MGKRMKHVSAILAALAVTLVISLGVYAMGGSAFFSAGDTPAAAQSTASNISTSASATANTPSRGRGRSVRNVDGLGEGANQGGAN
jgi:hypothetical protein